MKKQAARRFGCRPTRSESVNTEAHAEVHVSAGKYILNGEEVTKEEWDAHEFPEPISAGVKPGDPWSGGVWSDAFGCDPKEIPARQAELKSLGIDTEYDRDSGCAKIRGRQHRKAMLKAHNFVDYDAGYGETYNHEQIDPAAGCTDEHLSNEFQVERGEQQ